LPPETESTLTSINKLSGITLADQRFSKDPMSKVAKGIKFVVYALDPGEPPTRKRTLAIIQNDPLI